MYIDQGYAVGGGCLLKLFLTTVTLIVYMRLAGSSGVAQDITSTISKAEPTTKQDGTAAHPYAAVSQCPPSTDLIFWPIGRSIPSFPPDRWRRN